MRLYTAIEIDDLMKDQVFTRLYQSDDFQELPSNVQIAVGKAFASIQNLLFEEMTKGES